MLQRNRSVVNTGTGLIYSDEAGTLNYQKYQTWMKICVSDTGASYAKVTVAARKAL